MTTRSTLILGLCCAALAACNGEPEPNDRSPLYRGAQISEPSSGERGSLMINEINWAGSVSDEGVYDPDDIFIELLNKHPRPINVSGWRLLQFGDITRNFRLPTIEQPIPPNGFFVIAKKDDGAFPNADLYLPDLELGQKHVHLELRDNDRRLMEDAGSEEDRIFAGGWDTYSVRSMERVQLIFANRGGDARSWHAYYNVVDETPEQILRSRGQIAQGYRMRTFASPGEANSPDYSGSASGGNFE